MDRRGWGDGEGQGTGEMSPAPNPSHRRMERVKPDRDAPARGRTAPGHSVPLGFLVTPGAEPGMGIQDLRVDHRVTPRTGGQAPAMAASTGTSGGLGPRHPLPDPVVLLSGGLSAPPPGHQAHELPLRDSDHGLCLAFLTGHPEPLRPSAQLQHTAAGACRLSCTSQFPPNNSRRTVPAGRSAGTGLCSLFRIIGLSGDHGDVRRRLGEMDHGTWDRDRGAPRSRHRRRGHDFHALEETQGRPEAVHAVFRPDPGRDPGQGEGRRPGRGSPGSGWRPGRPCRRRRARAPARRWHTPPWHRRAPGW